MTTRPTRRLALRAAGLLLALTLAGCATTPPPTEVRSGLVLRGATVVDVRTGTLRPGMDVVIDGGRIVDVAARPVRTGGTAQVVDASGRYLVPGYNDMHTHALPPSLGPKPLWPMLVAHGVTGVREMAGAAPLVQAAAQLNARSAKGEVIAPEILQIPGPIFLGAPTAEAAAEQVRQMKAMGAGFVKVVGGNRETTLAVLREARVQGLDVAGHLSPLVSSEEAAAAGMRAVEHLGAGLGVLLDCTDQPQAVREALLRGEGADPPFSPAVILSPMLFRAKDTPLYQRVLQGYSPERCAALAASFARHGTWHVPTLVRLRGMNLGGDPALRNDPDLQYVDKAVRTQWLDLGRQWEEKMPAVSSQTFRAFFDKQAQLVPVLQRAGVKMLTGSDLGGIWVVPGAGLHREFAELAAAGLTPLQVLQMTTLNAAQFLRREATMGTVEPGRTADLVLLEANPLQSVAHLGRIQGVVLKGRWLPAAQLQAMKDAAAAANR